MIPDTRLVRFEQPNQIDIEGLVLKEKYSLTQEEKSSVEKLIRAEHVFATKLLTTRILVPAVGAALMAHAAYRGKWLRFGFLLPTTIALKTLCGYYVMYSFVVNLNSQNLTQIHGRL